ncbi:MAG: zinc ABC transporter substrate-binding protein, partial [Pseudomonadota bacterium]
ADHDEHGHEEHAGHDHDHGEFDPHAWQSLENAVTYVDNITAALAQKDADNAGTFYQNRAAYVSELEALDEEIHALLATLPEDRRTIVTSHDAFQYFGRDYDLSFLAPQGLSTESEASAQDVAGLIEQMRAEGIAAVFLENVTDGRLLEQIANETGASIGGTLYPGALSEPDGPAATYLDMMRHNATTLAEALGS